MLAAEAFGLGGLSLTDFGGADFVGGGVAGALEGAPHVPTGDGAVGAPALAEGEEFLGLGHMLFAVGDGPAFFYAEVVDGEDVGAAEAEDQEHFDGPGADAADGDEALDEFIVGELFGLFEGGDNAADGLLGEVFHGEDFCAGETGLAERALFEFQHFLGCGNATGGAESFDAAEDGGGRFARDGLVGDGFEKDFIRAIRAIHLNAEFFGLLDQQGELRILCCKGIHCETQVERRHAKFLGHGVAPDSKTSQEIISFVGRKGAENCFYAPCAATGSVAGLCYYAEFMQTGIIGLPQVGKTTLFRILTKAHVEGKGGASATHVGVAKVPEPRLVELAKLYSPKKITYATENYVDLGGMQKERMRDALAQLREVDVIAHVIRVFDDPSVPHSEGSIDPLRDATNLDLELMLSDHD